jgi:hypothetical protein
MYFLETGHNLYGEFRQYWDEHEGLCKLGYPLTEPVPMSSQSDGKVYITQKFEKGTLELHPGNGSTPDHIVVTATVHAQPGSDCGTARLSGKEVTFPLK